ncbi:MAG TPA: phosphoribosylanthranilate isomerase [Chthoniobacterales bacterium]|nr:phosphoribosylanthranilate isomerase [Chthoniobacterales bacterium]
MFGGKLRASDHLFVKICGITNELDALAAIEAGADALGFNLVGKSKRYIDIEKASDWLGKLPSSVYKVAITADPNWEDACRIARLPFVDALQLHGNESPEFCRGLGGAGIRFAKAVPVEDSKSLKDLPDFTTDTLVLDSRSGGDFGGTGRVFPWRLARDFVLDRPSLNIVLAGGLTPRNVAEAVSVVGPRGVDVTSGVELSPGRKDRDLVKAFVKAARGLGV